MPQHKRGPWSQTEDQYLLHLVQVHGAHNWVRISSTIQTRSPKQCRERFHQNLKPNLNHDPITPEEGLLIEQMVAEMGKRWAEIARRLHGRSDNAVKNWWNGGMNRRTRSNNNRRAELALHHPSSNMALQADRLPAPPLPSHHYQLPFNYPQQIGMPQQFFGQPMYHPGQIPQHIQQTQIPSNTPVYNNRHSGSMGDAPLPSPSAYSQMSAEGAPSLISDSSSISTHSTNDTSPVQLPPLSGPRDERRHSSAPMLRLNGSGPYVTDGDFQMPSMPMKQPQQPMLQEPFMSQPPPQQQQQQQHMQQFPHPMQYLPSQPRNPAPFQYAPMPQHQQQQQQHFFHHQQQQPQRNSFPPAQALPSTPVHLPSISNLSHTSANGQQKLHGVPLDPAALAHAQLQFTPDGSPRDKMSLSNLTH